MVAAASSRSLAAAMHVAKAGTAPRSICRGPFSNWAASLSEMRWCARAVAGVRASAAVLRFLAAMLVGVVLLALLWRGFRLAYLPLDEQPTEGAAPRCGAMAGLRMPRQLVDCAW